MDAGFPMNVDLHKARIPLGTTFPVMPQRKSRPCAPQAGFLFLSLGLSFSLSAAARAQEADWRGRERPSEWRPPWPTGSALPPATAQWAGGGAAARQADQRGGGSGREGMRSC